MFKRTFKDFKNLKKWEHVILCWECYKNRKHQNCINKLKLSYLEHFEIYSKFACRNKFKYSIKKQSRMKTLNTQKLLIYCEVSKLLPYTDKNKKYRRNLSLKLFAMVGFMIFEYIILYYLFSMLLHVIFASVVAYFVYNYLYTHGLTFYCTIYTWLFKNDKKMMECLDE
jgi:hypothetical protein